MVTISKIVKTGNLRARGIRLIWYWQFVNSIMIALMFFKDYPFYWYYLAAVPVGIYLIVKVSRYDSNVTMVEEFEFLYKRQPIRRDMQKLISMVDDLDRKINRLQIQKKEVEP